MSADMKNSTRNGARHFSRLLVVAFILLTAVSWRLAAQNSEELKSTDVLNHLNSIISWYRYATSDVRGVGLPSDAIYQDNMQTLGTQAVQLAFQSARAEAALIDAQHNGKPAGNETAPPGNTQQQNLERTQANITTQIANLDSQIASLSEKIAKTGGESRKSLISRRDALQGQLELNKAMEDAIGKMSSFFENTENNTEGLVGRVNELARSVPEAVGAAAAQKASAKASAQSAPPASTGPGGLWGEASALIDALSTLREMDQLSKYTAHVRETINQVRQPLRDTLRGTIEQGRQLAGQPPASAVAQSTAAQVGQSQPIQKEFQDLTSKFKQLAAAAVPLSQEQVVLDQSQSNLGEWRASVVRQAEISARGLLARVITILLALVLIYIFSEVWRRFTFRYIHDPRRRRQFLLLRRFAVGFLFAVVISLGFVSEFGSLATFAGFITAGIAVSLQAVLLSVAAYFFLIGRWGVRVGDRITISGVTGDVMDVGLVRLHVVELAGTGVDLYPTGRIVVLSNSVLFQASTPLYKQIPGTEYAWHEVAVDLVPGANYKLVQEKLLAAVNSVYGKYRQEIERQHSDIKTWIDFELTAPIPSATLQFTDAGIEYVVRYPVEIRRSSAADEEVTRAILEIIDLDPQVKAAVSGSPKIRAAVKG
jgi:small-conductance mechanosensitive channel